MTTIQPESKRVASSGSTETLQKSLMNAGGLLLAIVLSGSWVFWSRQKVEHQSNLQAPISEPTRPSSDFSLPAVIEESEPEPAIVIPPEPAPEPRAMTGPDPIAIAEASAELDRSLELLNARTVQESLLIEDQARLAFDEMATTRQAKDRLQESEDLADQLQAEAARVQALESTHDKLFRELEAIESSPPPREALNQHQNPVARSITGEEFHFEIRGNRITYVDLDGLLELVEPDARKRIRISGSSSTLRPITGTVGPIGSFELQYEVGSTGLGLSADPFGPISLTSSYGLRGFEVVPINRLRGVTLDQAFHPTSEFGRILRTLNPGRSAITLWVYPDGFALFRTLRDQLHQLGFVVAARPLPAGMAIRGGPNGSRSAGQ